MQNIKGGTLLSKAETWWQKVGNLGSSFPGNFDTWREILIFQIKKYIRNWKSHLLPEK